VIVFIDSSGTGELVAMRQSVVDRRRVGGSVLKPRLDDDRLPGFSRHSNEPMTKERARLAGDAPRRGGPAIGVLMLETRFARPVGDIGNRNGFDFPLLFETVRGAAVERVVRGRAEGLLAPFVAAGRRLVARGAGAIATSCGFLAIHQRALAGALPVPVAASSLLQVPWVNALLPPGRCCGVITFDADALDGAHLAAAGAPADTPVAGMPRGGALQSAVLDDTPLDLARVRGEAVGAARALLRRHPDVAALVLECTNLPPYSSAIRQACGVPVYDARNLLEWLWRGLAPATR
jgi:hypothetical protein